MNSAVIASLVRGWVSLYTRGLGPELRAARRDEVDDDLWCQHEEAALTGRSSTSLNIEMFTRWLLGVPADLSWRLSHAGGAGAPAPERKSSTVTRVIGALAIIGGASWLSAAVIGSSGEGGDVWVFSVSGALAFSGALAGLTMRYQDHLTETTALTGALAAISALIVPMGGLYLFIPMLPIGSAVLVRQLARAGIFPIGLTIAHVVTSLGFLTVVVVMLISWQILVAAPWLFALAIPYFLSWISIGAFILRGVPEVPVPEKNR